MLACRASPNGAANRRTLNEGGIHLQSINIFLLFHAIVLSIMNVLYAIICYSASFFGTNLLIQCQVPVVFSLFLVFQEIGTKRSPNTTKLSHDFFLDKRGHGCFGRRSEDTRGDGKATRHAQGLGAPSCLVGPSWIHLT
ncbi:hypothetical protein D1007_10955 [Hordeum vulgare]|nr:hypothetical protein D1007_10955 [Hordeum vulgare]